jgi:uncharacterized protein (DUF433 family)
VAIDAARQALEEERMARVPGIYFADEGQDRSAKIVGTGLDVWEIISQYQNAPGDLAALCKMFDWLEPNQLRAAVAYYEAYPREIDAAIAENDAVFDDLESNGPYVFSPGGIRIRYPRKNGGTPSG